MELGKFPLWHSRCRLGRGDHPITFAAMQMVDVYLPTTDGRHLILSRYTEPERDQQILLQQLGLRLPPQPPPKVTANAILQVDSQMAL